MSSRCRVDSNYRFGTLTFDPTAGRMPFGPAPVFGGSSKGIVSTVKSRSAADLQRGFRKRFFPIFVGGGALSLAACGREPTAGFCRRNRWGSTRRHYPVMPAGALYLEYPHRARLQQSTTETTSSRLRSSPIPVEQPTRFKLAINLKTEGLRPHRSAFAACDCRRRD
jgi:hypothetical protein